jgi:hypothetical protein
MLSVCFHPNVMLYIILSIILRIVQVAQAFKTVADGGERGLLKKDRLEDFLITLGYLKPCPGPQSAVESTKLPFWTRRSPNKRTLTRANPKASDDVSPIVSHNTGSSANISTSKDVNTCPDQRLHVMESFWRSEFFLEVRCI